MSLLRVFSRFDKDGSSFISEDEFMIAVVGETFENVGIAFYLNQLTDWIRRNFKVMNLIYVSLTSKNI